MKKRQPPSAFSRVYDGHVAMTRHLRIVDLEEDLVSVERDAGVSLSEGARNRLATSLKEYVSTYDYQSKAPLPGNVRRARHGKNAPDEAKRVADSLKELGAPLPRRQAGRPANDMLPTFLTQLIEIFETTGTAIELPRADFHEEGGGFYNPKDGLGRTPFAKFIDGISDILPEDIEPRGDGLLWAMHKHLKNR